MATAGGNNRQRECSQTTGKRRAHLNQRHGLFRAFLHFLEIIAAGKHSRLASENDNGLILLCLVQRGIQRVKYLMAQSISLAIVHGNGGNAVVQFVSYEFCHLDFLIYCQN